MSVDELLEKFDVVVIADGSGSTRKQACGCAVKS